MGPIDQATSLTIGSNSDATSLSVPKLRDDRSNWSDYLPRVERALGAKGLWRHVLGTAIAPKPYALVSGVPVLPDGRTPAMEEQIESKESKIADFERKEYLAQHVNDLDVTWSQDKELEVRERNVGCCDDGCNIKEYPIYPQC